MNLKLWNPLYRKIINTYLWSRCASYDLKNITKGLVKVVIRSPLSVYVIFHSKDQLSIPKELASYKKYEGYHVIELSVMKTIDLNQEGKPCYEPSENNDVGFGEHDYKLLMNKIMTKYNCTTPYIPAEFRKGSKICQNTTMNSKVHELIKYSSSTHATNLWMADYYSDPPCVYQSYSMRETIRGEGKSPNSNINICKIFIYTGKKIYRYLKEGVLNKGRSEVMYINFKSKMVVTEQFWVYSFLAYVAENGGFVGLFLGYSVLQLKDIMNYVLDAPSFIK